MTSSQSNPTLGSQSVRVSSECRLASTVETGPLNSGKEATYLVRSFGLGLRPLCSTRRPQLGVLYTFCSIVVCMASLTPPVLCPPTIAAIPGTPTSASRAKSRSPGGKGGPVGGMGHDLSPAIMPPEQARPNVFFEKVLGREFKRVFIVPLVWASFSLAGGASFVLWMHPFPSVVVCGYLQKPNEL